MKNRQLNPSPMNDRAISNDPIAELFKTLEGSGRLTASDKPIFATNLGKLAARLSPDDPLDGARRIVIQAGNESLWPTKRKKYFRLPGENAPPAGKDGAYASNPSQFRKLAESAGELLCASKKPEAIELEKRKAVKALADGSSFMPHYVPTNISDKSAIELLDEYAARLVRAIKSKTRITQLWDILKTTQIGLESFWADEATDAIPSPYGSAAEFPTSLLHPVFRKGVVSGRFKTNIDFMEYGYFDKWTEPTLEIGYLEIGKQISMFRIPEAQRAHFSPERCVDGKLHPLAIEWMESVGFDGDACTFPGPGVWAKDMGWRDALAVIMQSVGIGIQRGPEPKIKLETWGDFQYSAEFLDDLDPDPRSDLDFKGFKEKYQTNHTFSQHWSYEFNKNLNIDVIYRDAIEIDGEFESVAIGILPSGWAFDRQPSWKSSVFTESGVSVEDIVENYYSKGWTENPHIANILLGNEGIFHPIWPDASAIAGVFAEDSLAASLMQNQRTAAKENLITTHLVDKVALTAEAGLKFYEAMVDDLRSAIHRI